MYRGEWNIIMNKPEKKLHCHGYTDGLEENCIVCIRNQAIEDYEKYHIEHIKDIEKLLNAKECWKEAKNNARLYIEAQAKLSYLPTEEEIYLLLKDWIVESKSPTEEMGMYGTDDEERMYLAKVIYKRQRGIK